MLCINLLPTKAAKKHESVRQELMAMIVLLIVVLGGLFVWSHKVASELSTASARIAKVNQEISQLKQDVVRIEDFKKNSETLEKKIAVIENLQLRRTGPAQMLDDLATILTDQRKVWLTRLAEGGGKLTLEGAAMEHENISDFQLALQRRSKFFQAATLGTVHATTNGGLPVLEWKLTCLTNYTGG